MALACSSPVGSPVSPRKRKRSNSSSWTASLLSFFKRQKTEENEYEDDNIEESNNSREEEQRLDPDLVDLILQNDLKGLLKHIHRPAPHPPFCEREEGITPFSQRKLHAESNPLYVAALVNRLEAAKILLDYGWKIAEDRTMMSKEVNLFSSLHLSFSFFSSFLITQDFYVPSRTPLGVAFEKQNEVLGLFLTRLVELEVHKLN